MVTGVLNNYEATAYFEQTTKRDEDGRFIVRIPFKNNLEKLGFSRDSAWNRFEALEKRFLRNPNSKRQYQKFMGEYKWLCNDSNILNEFNVDEQMEELWKQKIGWDDGFKALSLLCWYLEDTWVRVLGGLLFSGELHLGGVEAQFLQFVLDLRERHLVVKTFDYGNEFFVVKQGVSVEFHLFTREEFRDCPMVVCRRNSMDPVMHLKGHMGRSDI
ncbi:hypothetical protein D910_10984 [Dendroctonus ponderosae]|uniref:Uncharacterized protein n=1 Tax=Dendroctonus ponderosae TaxID=77166 RepID=U4UKQ4_DENPD|nr:hypothetical protein D910_10984 [Dendroctonus ponderosae]